MSIALSIIAVVVVCGIFASQPQLPIISVSEVAGVLLAYGMTTFKLSLRLWVQIFPSPPKHIGRDWNHECAI